MKQAIKKIQNRKRRHARVRATVQGTPSRPRLAFFRSNKNVYAQLIDDTQGKTLAASSSLKLTGSAALVHAKQIGEEIASKGIEKGIKTVVFDRGGFIYTGSVKVFADAARAGGLQF